MLNIKNQSGIATLLVAMVTLFIMTISVFLVNRVALTDIFNSSAQIQSSRAKEAAEAGVHFVLAELNDDVLKQKYFCGSYIRSNTTACSTPAENNSGNSYIVASTADQAYTTASSQAFTVTITRPSPTGPISLRSTGGKPDCLTGVTCNKKIINVLLSVDPLFSKMPPDALSSPGQIGLTGSICVQNSSGNGGFAARAGEKLATTNNLQGAGCAAANGNGLFGAIATTDKNLASMNGTLQNKFSSDAGFSKSNESNYFEYLFGESETHIYQEADERLGGAHATSGNAISSFSGCPKSCAKVIWISDQALFDLGNATYGSEAEPVIIILNGAGVINGSPTINGMLYTSGSLTVHGNPTINGAVSAGGAISGNGNLTILYNKSIFDNTLTLPSGFTVQGGSWRDW
ncbi:hypothetical protein ABHF33_08520 [Chitinibacter sp. FCG-7]|uniref:Type 4 fimbrial biogenesis protein PilX N-terminal domain-containing protein n=1 Tax=Chitinibacter mangrovi TaxID=3153927 RepID=A0AAU7FF81_9NEIS